MANTFGKYILERKLGQGGMGAVYLALDPALNRKVALKIITSNDAELLERFQREAQAVAKLKHPNIVQVYEAGAAGKQHYFTMDYIEGISLEQAISSAKRPNIQNIARIVLQVASALHYAHGQHIIHRDIKPANIMITKQGQAYITDFGLAKQLTGLDRSLTMSGTAIGTPNYMSPEQAQGKKDEVDPRSDIFSLGATMYHCLTGRMPFAGNEIYEVISKVINVDPPAPSTIVRIIPKDLETICLKCLNKDKAKRYQTAGELARDLKRYLEGEEIAARRTGLISKLRIKAARNKAASLSIIGAAIILIIVVISLLISSSNKRHLIAQYRQEAEQLFRDSQYDKTKAACNKLLALAPQDEDIQSLLKRCEKIIKAQDTKKQQEDEQAKEAAAKAQKTVDIRAQAKSILDRAGGAPAPDQKIEFAQEALKIDPTYGDAWQVIGYAYKEKANHAGSFDEYQKLTDKAFEYFSKAIKTTPTLAYSYYERAVINVINYNRPEEAMTDFEMVLKYDPNSYIGWFAKGNIAQSQNKNDEAIDNYTKAIELYPENTWAYNNRAIAYKNKGELDKAIADCSEAIRIDPKYADAYTSRGLAYKNKGALDRAIKDYDEAIRLNPKSARAYMNRGIAYKNKGELDKALADYNEAIRIDPKDAIIYTNRGNVYDLKGELDKAIADYNEAIRLNPKYAVAYSNRGSFYYNKGELDKAIADYTQAICFDPGYISSYKNRGVAYCDKKEFGKAIADLERYLELAPKNSETPKIRQIIEDIKRQLGK
ncbi:MAG: tetratricopeptide repeat protein [Planctomycetota bacterium]